MRPSFLVGIVLHALLLPVFLASGLVVPWWVIPLLLAVWAGVLAAMVRWRTEPAVIAGPLVALSVLVAVVTAGEALFDWTA